MTADPRYPSLYQINTRAWLTELALASGAEATFDIVPDEALDEIAALGFDWVWMLGVWQTGHIGHEIASSIPELIKEYRRVLPDFSPEDICGSPFAVQDYHVHRDFGGDKALARFRRRLSRCGLKLLLDFVPNHTAIDHPWAYQHPEYYVHGSQTDITSQPYNYRLVDTNFGKRILAHGRDPYFPGWTDTFQLNYHHASLRREMISVLKRIAGMCDGVRCDMAMLLLTDVISKTWGERSLPQDGSLLVDDPFWTEAIPQVKETAPNFLFMAEVYWDLEYELQQQGFDYTYDKRLYDRLRAGNVSPVRDHLGADLEYQRKLVRFLENHDEERAARTFPGEMGSAAAVLCYFAPGMRFFHQGQLEGHRIRLPVQLCRRPNEPLDESLHAFYTRLLTLLQRHVLRLGDWRMLVCRPASSEDPSWQNFITYAWYDPEMGKTHPSPPPQLLVLVNYNREPGRCSLKPWSGDDYASLSFKQVTTSNKQLHPPKVEAGKLTFDLPAWGYQVIEIKTWI